MPSPVFPNTRWSLIVPRESPPEAAARAAEELCGLYWKPVYAFILSGGAPHRTREDAEDLTQGFFLSLLRGDFLRNADPAKGKLRSYLLSAVKHYLLHMRRHDGAQKRGGGLRFVQIDVTGEHDRAVARLSAETLTPEEQFDRRWAECLLDNSLKRLRTEYEARGRGHHYTALRPLLAADGHDRAELQTRAGEALGLGPGTLRVAFHRFRQRYQETFKEEIQSALLPGMDPGAETAYLVKLLRAPRA